MNGGKWTQFLLCILSQHSSGSKGTSTYEPCNKSATGNHSKILCSWVRNSSLQSTDTGQGCSFLQNKTYFMPLRYHCNKSLRDSIPLPKTDERLESPIPQPALKLWSTCDLRGKIPLDNEDTTFEAALNQCLNSITDYCRLAFDQSGKVIKREMKSAFWRGDKWQNVHTHIVIQL